MVKHLGLALFFIGLLFGPRTGRAATAASLEKRALAHNAAGQEVSQSSRDTHASSTWSTLGSGSCATGNLTCNSSNRQIGCTATGDNVYCSYQSGDVGSVYCQSNSNDGTESSFTDQCP